MTIYELSNQWQWLMELAEDPDTDPEVFKATMEALDGDIEDKADGYAKVITSITGDINLLKEEIDRLTARKRAAEANIKRMKETLQYAMEATDKRKFKTQLFSFSIQKNPVTVVIDNEEALPQEYLIEQAPKIDKTALKDALKAGVDMGGICHLEQTESLRIR